jgi:molybdate transport system regulatory protein
MRIAYRIWLVNDGKAFGEGPFQLLRMVVKEGSLLQAAKSMKMSYQKAWVITRRCEELLGFPLLERRIGGTKGGGSQVTEAGKEFMKTYGRFRKETEKKLNAAFKKYFGRPFLVSPVKTKKKDNRFRY